MEVTLSQVNSLLSPNQVRAILKQAGSCSQLNDHLLTRTQLFRKYLAGHPERSGLPPGETLLWLLFDLWREEMYPEHLWPELAREWNRYLTLGVMYFLPLLKGKRPTAPLELEAACAKLRRRDKLVLLIANDNSALANELLGAEHEAFWLRLIPPKKKLTVPTLAARRDAAVEVLTRWLTDRLVMTEASLSQLESPETREEAACEPVIVNSTEPEVAIRSPSNHGREQTYPQRMEQPWIESQVASNGLFVFRRLSSPIDYWLDEPDKRHRLAGELQTIWAMLTSLGPTTHLTAIQGWLPTSFSSEPEDVLMKKPGVIQSLIDNLLSTDLEERVLRYAVLLQRVDLAQPLTVQIEWPAVWNSRRLTGIECLAEAADDWKQPHFNRAVIRALLAREEYLLKLWTLHSRYYPLVCDLLLTLGKNLHWNEEMSEWEVTD